MTTFPLQSAGGKRGREKNKTFIEPASARDQTGRIAEKKYCNGDDAARRESHASPWGQSGTSQVHYLFHSEGRRFRGQVEVERFPDIGWGRCATEFPEKNWLLLASKRNESEKTFHFSLMMSRRPEPDA